MNKIYEVIDDGTQPIIGDAHWHERDEMGRNWNIRFVRKGTAYIDAVRAIVERMRLEFVVVTPRKHMKNNILSCTITCTPKNICVSHWFI